MLAKRNQVKHASTPVLVILGDVPEHDRRQSLGRRLVGSMRPRGAAGIALICAHVSSTVAAKRRRAKVRKLTVFGLVTLPCYLSPGRR
jgi:hypothetical protein